MISITIEHLSKRFDGRVALDDVQLEIAAGEIFFLLGPSGCGKTTLLRTLAGFTEPDAGRVLFGQADVTRQPPHLRNTGMMFQSYALWPHLTVARNVAFGLEERRVPRAKITRRVGEALESVQLSGCGDRRIHQLSGGQQQRVALARALVLRPACLLLDEPLSNLDAKLRAEMRGEIRRICRAARLTAIYVTHDQKEALSIADRMAILRAGRVLQIGTPAELYRRPASQFVAGFMGASNFLPGEIRQREGDRAWVVTPLGTFVVRMDNPGWPLNSEVTLSIRPESWRIGPAGRGNEVAGRIVEQAYLGDTAEYAIRIGGTMLRVIELNPRETERARPEISVSVAPEDVMILPRERAS